MLLPADKVSQLRKAYNSESLRDYGWVLRCRAECIAQYAGITSPEDTCDFAYHCWHRMGDVALAWRLWGGASLASWLETAVTRLVHLPEQEWAGPWFRAHGEPPVGHLETAHYAQALYAVLDLASDALTPGLQEAALATLAGKALPQCLRWLDRNEKSRHNQRMVLTSGLSVCAVLTGNNDALQRAGREIRNCLQFFEDDGSYGEPYQYWTYGAMNLNLAIEALRCAQPAYITDLDEIGLKRGVDFAAGAWIGNRPAERIDHSPVPRVVNFGDSATFFRPSADLLLSLAARHQMGVARWLFDQLYGDPSISVVGGGLSGTYTGMNYLGYLRLPEAPAPLAPALQRARRFQNGNIIMRDAVTEPACVLAVRGYAWPRLSAHTHADFGTFILAYKGEVLVADPGHSCYRSALAAVHDKATAFHNIWTFSSQTGGEQGQTCRRYFAARSDEIRKSAENLEDDAEQLCFFHEPTGIYVASTYLAGAYGPPIEEACRLFLRLSDHVVIVVDIIKATEPVAPQWHFILNDRDRRLQLRRPEPDRIVFRRNEVGAKLFGLCPALKPGQLSFCHVHDYYEVEPGQPGEGRSGTGKRITWSAVKPAKEHVAGFAFAMDSLGGVATWHLTATATGEYTLASPLEAWRFSIDNTAVWVEREGRRLTMECKNPAWMWRKGD